jgi:hypothetical protein
LVKPNARIEPAISATWASLWVRALRGDGRSRSSGQCSSRGRWRSTSTTAVFAFIALPSVLLVSALATPPTRNFAAIFRDAGNATGHDGHATRCTDGTAADLADPVDVALAGQKKFSEIRAKMREPGPPVPDRKGPDF